ncbi:MAG: TOBE domain-containing protein [Sulfurovum sp.]|nr:TOBE domain-containing protein [Sulfurovum sp.]MDD3500323.1 TOBE domain-containing protein [Sulfurovum sp.]
MNQLGATINKIKSVGGITHIYADVAGSVFSVLVLSGDEAYQENQRVNLLFKETEVMIATCDSNISARNAFISHITYMNTGELLAEVHFDFKGEKIVCIVTKEALDDLQCRVGDPFKWIVKSNEVSIQIANKV